MPRHVHYKHHRPRHGLRHDRHIPVLRVTTVGAQQYSANGGDTPNWQAAIDAGNLKANTTADYYVRINPADIVPADDGSYHYNFQLIPDPVPGGPGHETDGIGGMKLTWVKNYAHISGKVPADQVGKKITIRATVTDMSGNAVTATDLVGTWTA